MIYTNNYNDVRTTALLEAINLCDGAKNLALAIKVSHLTIDAWLTDPSIIIDLDTALKIEQATGVTIERLITNNPKINHQQKNIGFVLREIPKNIIITINSVSLPFSQPDSSVIIGTDAVLISGLAILNTHSENTIKVLILDLISLLCKTRYLSKGLLNKLLISERVAIGLRLEQLINNQQKP